MAKNITIVEHVIKNDNSTERFTNYARCTIVCPVSELAALLVLAGLTNTVSATITDRIVAIGDKGGA